jgi:hypothetical protein
MNTAKPTFPAPKPDPIVACTVLVAKTQIGAVLKGKGAKVRLPKSQAETLRDLGKVRIDGI